ncbi:MAG TPA: hypothetical protein VGL94_12855 [Ktedonobacteraceae bacterium]
MPSLFSRRGDKGKGPVRSSDNQGAIQGTEESPGSVERRHRMFTSGGDGKSVVDPAAREHLEATRAKNGMKSEEGGASDSRPLDKKTIERALYEPKHALKQELDFLSSAISIKPVMQDRDSGVDSPRLVNHLIDRETFLVEVADAILLREDASSYIKRGTTKHDLNLTLKDFQQKLPEATRVVRDYRLQLAKWPNEIAQDLEAGISREIDTFTSTVKNNLYLSMLDSRDWEEFQGHRTSSEQSQRVLFPDTAAPPDFSTRAGAFLKFRKANQELSKIIEKQKTPDKIRAGLAEQLALADGRYEAASLRSRSKIMDVADEKNLQESMAAIETARAQLTVWGEGGIQQANLAEAIQVFEALAHANKQLESIMEENLPGSSSSLRW